MRAWEKDVVAAVTDVNTAAVLMILRKRTKRRFVMKIAIPVDVKDIESSVCELWTRAILFDL